MAHHPAPSSPSTDPPASLVRAELDRILATELFTRSERLSAFLKFIVDRTLAGEGHALKEHVIAIEVYGKSVDLSTAVDPIVRVDARRLRDRLREYYDTDDDRGIVISVPKGSYTPAFHRRDDHIHTPAPVQLVPRAEGIVPVPTQTPVWKRWWIVAAALALMGAGWGVGRVLIDGRSEPYACSP